MGYRTILVDRTDGIATITLNRPEARNALDLVMRRELLATLDELDADAACRVAVLTGAEQYLVPAHHGALVSDPQAVDLVVSALGRRAKPPGGAEAVLIPDTAMHSLQWIDRLEAAVGLPVLTANQVTVWQGLRLLGDVPRYETLGTLFRTPSRG